MDRRDFIKSTALVLVSSVSPALAAVPPVARKWGVYAAFAKARRPISPVPDLDLDVAEPNDIDKRLENLDKGIQRSMLRCENLLKKFADKIEALKRKDYASTFYIQENVPVAGARLRFVMLEHAEGNPDAIVGWLGESAWMDLDAFDFNDQKLVRDIVDESITKLIRNCLSNPCSKRGRVLKAQIELNTPIYTPDFGYLHEEGTLNVGVYCGSWGILLKNVWATKSSITGKHFYATSDFKHDFRVANDLRK